MTESRYSRQVLAFGENGQRRIADAHVAIIGAGGLGSHVAQQASYLGVGEFTLIDPDRVEVSNLNRLVGATPSDVRRSKVDVAADAITRVNEKAKVTAIPKNLRTREALRALERASVVFGCVDNDGARLILMELCCAYRKLYIDSATEIVPSVDSRPFDFGGRVVVSVPGEFCLSCAGELDFEAAKVDLESTDVRELREAHGYGIPAIGIAPAVVSLNGLIASIAVTEFLVVTAGIRPPRRKSTYKGMRGVVQVSTDDRRPGCMNCEYLVGRGEHADLLRYALA